MPGEDLRSALEAAYDTAEREAPAAPEEGGRPPENTEEPVRNTAPTERSEPEGSAKGSSGVEGAEEPKETESPADEVKPGQPEAKSEAKPETPKSETRPSTKAPESWKPLAKEHWAKLPSEVQAEVARREREITQTLQQTAEDRKLANHFKESIRPFEHMIRAENRDPVTAASELFATAALLRTGTPAQKAQLVAGMVKNFGIDIQALDSALVGETVPDEQSKFSQLLDQRLQPVMGFLEEIKGLRAKREQETSNTVRSEIEEFAGKPENEFFDYVREDMADLMEMASRRGAPMTLKDAYDRATKINAEVQQIVQRRKEEQLAGKREAAASLPSKGASNSSKPTSSGNLRGDIESAISSLASR